MSFRNEPRIGARLNAAAAGTAYKVKEGSGMEPAADLTGEVGAAAIKDELLEITGERTAQQSTTLPIGLLLDLRSPAAF